MSASKPVVLPSIKFAKQQDAKDYFKQMLARYSDGQRINEADSALLAELLHRKPKKIGAGIDYFYREKSRTRPTSGFHVVQLDDNWTDFSYIDCIELKEVTPQDYFYRACRYAVTPYLTEKKKRIFESGTVVCSKTSEMVTAETSHYRHTSPSFTELLESFTLKNNLQIDFSLFSSDRDRQYEVEFLDSELRDQFIAYHVAHARLAIFKK